MPIERSARIPAHSRRDPDSQLWQQALDEQRLQWPRRTSDHARPSLKEADERGPHFGEKQVLGFRGAQHGVSGDVDGMSAERSHDAVRRGEREMRDVLDVDGGAERGSEGSGGSGSGRFSTVECGLETQRGKLAVRPEWVGASSPYATSQRWPFAELHPFPDIRCRRDCRVRSHEGCRTPLTGAAVA